MSTITTAAGNVDTTLGTLATQVAALVTAINASQTTYQAANPNRYQNGMVNFEDNIAAAITGASAQIAAILKRPPINPAPPALATQYAAF